MMEVLRFRRLLLLCSVLIFGAANAFSLQSTDRSLSAEAIVQKAVARAQAAARESCATPYFFSKVTVREERDARGQLEKRQKSCDEILFKDGAYTKKPGGVQLVSYGNSSPRPSNSSKSKGKSINRSEYLKMLTPDVLDRFEFTLGSTTNLNGRTAHAVCFRPRSSQPCGKDLQEKIANSASGTLWIDAQEFELVQAKGVVNTEIPVGGGILGALKRAAFSVERVRLETGVWFERFFESSYEARKLTETKRVVTQTEFRDFRRLNSEG